ncbi:MAG: acetyl-CoA hydrolase/transferase C-terminal domain-containing protein [Syntrophomonas sp.]
MTSHHSTLSNQIVCWQEEYRNKLCSAGDAAGLIRDNDVISMVGGTCIAHGFAHALSQRAGELHNITLLQGFTLSSFEFMQEKYRNNLHIDTAFVGPTERACIQKGLASYVPVHLHKIGEWLVSRRPNVVAATVTPPDEDGYMNRSSYASLCHRDVFKNAKTVIVEVNPNAPWLCGEDFKIHVSEVDYIIENHSPLEEVRDIAITGIEKQIAYYIADMIPDGSTIQLGLGGLANAVGHFLRDKKDLGLHTEVFSNSLMELMKIGAVNNSRKNFYPGKTLGCFCVGNRELSKFVDHNEDFVFFEVDYVNDPQVISKNAGLISVNNTLMLDLTGQAASESIGTFQYSGTGGQVDFVRGTSLSPGGKSILALNSTYKDKDGCSRSRIVPVLPEGTIVTTPRTELEYVITEYGVVNIRWQSVAERVKRLIRIAHPDFRDELYFQAKKIGWI